jgi:hypothetical protein
VRWHTLVGDPAWAIISCAEANQGSLIAMARRTSLEAGDAADPAVEMVDEHFAGPVFSGDCGEVLDRLGERGVTVELLSASSAGPLAIVTLDDAKEEPAARHRTMIRGGDLIG